MPPRAILLCHRIPYPPDKGDKIRSYHLLKFLAERYDVALGAFVDDPEDMVHREFLEGLCAEVYLEPMDPKRAKLRSVSALLSGKPLTMGYYKRQGMAAWVARQRAMAPVVEVAFSAAMAPFLEGGRAPVVVDMVDADSAKWSAYAREGGVVQRIIYGREGKRLAKEEGRITHWATRTFLVSPEEAALVRSLPGVNADRVDWFRNGIDTDYWRADASFPRDGAGFDIVFTGAMDYRPNIEAVMWFTAKVWPTLKADYPALRFGIVGAKPTAAVRRLGEEAGITVTGRVPDMRPLLASAKLAVAPLQIARGIQNKVLEAMAMGTPVVATTGAITGTAAVPEEHVLAADLPHEMVTAIKSLLDDPEAALALGRRGSEFIRAHFQWADTLDRLASALP